MHVFHKPRYTSHKLMGLWALAIRTAYIKDNQWWSAVNGIPVRYSIREHALLTGLCCDELPSRKSFAEKHSLSLSFAHRNFLFLNFRTSPSKRRRGSYQKFQNCDEEQQ
ncbi:hypothetical protein N665_0032s0032 [Sinapis alba]|nr:hypothetical protein N665_0032s0032 [Sinapis alba]